MNRDSGKYENIRSEYGKLTLEINAMHDDPIQQFRSWFDQYVGLKGEEANIMFLATASQDGMPSNRTVLLKEVTGSGFVFYTNYASRKGKELEQNPRAALVFYWGEMERQVRVEGDIEKISEEESERYFNSRPEGSRYSAMASPQSEKIESRAELEERVKELEEIGETKKPETWGGYLVKPTRIEFWQGRANRLHDRIVYESEDGAWKKFRLAP